jgi:hypothetical protein
LLIVLQLPLLLHYCYSSFSLLNLTAAILFCYTQTNRLRAVFSMPQFNWCCHRCIDSPENASPHRSIWLRVSDLDTLAVLLPSSHTFESAQQATLADGTDIRDDLTPTSCYKADDALTRSPHWNCFSRWQETWKLEQPMLIRYGSTSV